MKTILGALIVTLPTLACASAEVVPEPADITGIYTFSTAFQGMPLDGQMRIIGEPGTYDGSMYSDFTGELPFSTVTRSGDAVTVIAETPDGPVEISLRFEGETFTGSWTLGAEGGAIQGRKVR